MNGLRVNKRNIALLGLVGLGVLSLILFTGRASATPASDVTFEIKASGKLPEVVRAKFMDGQGGFTNGTEVKNIVVVRYIVQPGGSFGWHQHGGPLWVTVASGTLSIYSGDDPTCTPQLYGKDTAFIDPGNHTHIGRNETGDLLELYATFMLPKDGKTRIDVPDPGLCGF